MEGKILSKPCSQDGDRADRTQYPFCDLCDGQKLELLVVLGLEDVQAGQTLQRCLATANLARCLAPLALCLDVCGTPCAMC